MLVYHPDDRIITNLGCKITQECRLCFQIAVDKNDVFFMCYLPGWSLGREEDSNQSSCQTLFFLCIQSQCDGNHFDPGLSIPKQHGRR